MGLPSFALGKVGGDRAGEHLEAVINETESETVRQRAFAALSKIGTGTGSIETPDGSPGWDTGKSPTGGG